ncbi:MAG: biopolymer transporter ExbD [Fusobacteriia bacterium 4572_132]|nr:MAG: biopolymer transporter ExbD [Fusobacteriia bacterium 4572_132]
MRFKKIKRRNNQDLFLEITPLIDVVFLLLIFFMVSTTFVDVNTGINIVLPQSTITEISENREIIISITKNKKIYINKRQIGLTNFEKNLEKEIELNQKSNVIIKADKDIEYGFVVKIMTMSKNAGATELDIATKDEE